ncbi:polysaccharide deacetylase family protein [bacterium]|nr:polysaccharide deacetylase family protein [bacterium]
MKHQVPVCITCDIDPTPEAGIQEKIKAVEKSVNLFSEFGIKSTFFWVANVAEEYKSVFNKLLKSGHEIGCHGLNHGMEEEYSTMEEKTQRDMLSQATTKLKKITGQEIKSFRGPRVKTSEITQKILVELGYNVDSSVCSQRVDFISSNLINPGWIKAPRLPYHPHKNSAFKKGEVPILVVPVSAIVIPFISGSLYTFGLNWMKVLFNSLYEESLITGKPIVYLLHPAEFARKEKPARRKFSVKVEGFKFRRSSVIFEQNINKRYELNRKLFEFMAFHKGIRFMTTDQFSGGYVHKK